MARVYIIGAGPGANIGALQASSEHADVIAGNYGAVAAIDAGVKGGEWLVADPTIWEFDWAHRLIIAAHKAGWELGCSECTKVHAPNVKADWYFKQEPAAGLGDGALIPTDGPELILLRCGGTVASQMVQFAYFLGYTDIVLCGCQLSGGYYYDGRLVYEGLGDWPQKPTFEAVCDSVRQTGVNVVHFPCVEAANPAG